MLVYYDHAPPQGASLKRRGNSAPSGIEVHRGLTNVSGEPDEEGCGERYVLDGIECQVGHMSVGAFQREITKVVVDLHLDEKLLKIMSGLFEGLPLHGEELIERWRRRAAYTEELQRATIEKRWKLFPWWYFQERLRSRDAEVWRYDVLVQSAYSLVGVLAALNRVYFSTFEFKRASTLLSQLELAPPDLTERLDRLFTSDERHSTAELERLVAETQGLVAERFPDIDLSLEWAGIATPPGQRELPWSL